MLTKLQILKNPIYCLACGLGLGLIPFAPGTFGSLLGVFIYLIINFYSYYYLLLIGISFIVGVYICAKTAKALDSPDDSKIVWDEVVGFLITMINVKLSALTLLVGFILFRAFDIIKPWPIKLLDKKIHGGVGIMLDDCLAGIFACISLHLIKL